MSDAESDRQRHAALLAEFDAGVEAILARLERTAAQMVAAAVVEGEAA